MYGSMELALTNPAGWNLELGTWNYVSFELFSYQLVFAFGRGCTE